MNKIKCVAFDVGNVASWGGEDRLRKAQERWGESFCASDFKRMLAPALGDGVDYWRRFQNGLTSPDEYLSAAVRAAGDDRTLEPRRD